MIAVADMNTMIKAVRCLDLKLVAQASGATQDAHDTSKWHTARGILSINGSKFINWSNEIGGGGAIDLAMHLTGYDFKRAVKWLSRLECSALHQTHQSNSVKTHNQLILPQRDDSHLKQVVWYLHRQRAIPMTLIQQIIRDGALYADRKANAVFLLRNRDRAIVGAELRGTSATPWRGMAAGSNKSEGAFFVHSTGAKKIVICESTIDALSYFALDPGCFAISTAGARSNPEWLKATMKRAKQVYCGFDADETGDSLADKMIAAYPDIKRKRPLAHDWNEMLIKQSQSKSTTGLFSSFQVENIGSNDKEMDILK